MTEKSHTTLVDFLPFTKEHYRELRRSQLIRLSLTYLTPIILVTIFFSFQYGNLVRDSLELHLTAIAENQANTLNLFLMERIVNLDNLINSPRFLESLDSAQLQSHLSELTKISSTFVDIGFFNATGIQVAYAGPYPLLENRNYSSERWFQELQNPAKQFVITDIYLGFRQRPHFTIGVRREIQGELSALRATLDPGRIYQYMQSLEGASEVNVSLVNQEGFYQLVTPHIGTLLESAAIVPPVSPRMGAEEVEIEGDKVTYAYAWLKTADWALVVQTAQPPSTGLSSPYLRSIWIALPLMALISWAIWRRAGKLVQLQIKSDRTQAQLAHASKLASVGELAAGIAHEINNPLAVINEEAGLMKDLMNPEFGTLSSSPEELIPHLDSIQQSVWRCRDITHKLLGFVRKSNIERKKQDLSIVIDAVVEGLLGRELVLSDVSIVRKYSPDLPLVMTDENQLQQVLLNIVNNAVDALEGQPGSITIQTSRRGRWVHIKISDTGKGMTQDELSKIFLPFYTTKEVGKGTGLGLSVSYGIVEDLGGRIEVESTPGEGSTFLIVLPLE
jgi:two-component system NtrC family sensor kinase